MRKEFEAYLNHKFKNDISSVELYMAKLSFKLEPVVSVVAKRPQGSYRIQCYCLPTKKVTIGINQNGSLTYSHLFEHLATHFKKVAAVSSSAPSSSSSTPSKLKVLTSFRSHSMRTLTKLVHLFEL